MPAPAVYDHLRPTGDDHRDGVYRVVGTDDDSVTLLRVGDAAGQRVSTGDVLTVSRENLDVFESASNPDGNRPLGDRLTALPEHVYWSLRVFTREVAAHPVPGAVALALVAVGMLGDAFLQVNDAVVTILIVVGGFGLAFVGSGRL